MQRCGWAGTDPEMVAYHDQEWGVPSAVDRHLFEMLVLEGAQAGLSWRSVLRRRGGYSAAFHDWDPVAVSEMQAEELAGVLATGDIIRNRAKVAATVANARAWLAVVAEHGSFAAYLWGWVAGAPVVNHWARSDEVPAVTPLSERLSADLRRRGFAFVGPTIVYAYLQATGVVMDHLTTCFRHPQLADAGPPVLPAPAVRP